MTLLEKAHIEHMIRSIATITQCHDIVMIGSGALIATAKRLPAALMMTPEADVYVRDAMDCADIRDLIEGTLGEGTQFQRTFKYFVDAVGEKTAILPRDWESRSIKLTFRTEPRTLLTCPGPDDLAHSKCVSWREKDQEWLKICALHGLIQPDAMVALSASIDLDDLRDLTLERVRHRIDVIRPQTGSHTAVPAATKRAGRKKAAEKS